ncbi:hypothetical protein [Paenibacillus agilis]|uniref:Uncharacterized protein n=1 Tax=Paenibacillus agilis TaxID=3020863 RepID=A0A559IYE3_9BACL|nr:hypothetical protein [Paenibacillus agilis]TVX92652.1 hypothetical protein FPZ44_06080 [Paenibacillus agilis]
MVRSKQSAVAMAIMLSFVYAASIEVISIIIGQIEGPISIEAIIFGLTILYALPTRILYQNKYWPFALLIIVIAPLLSIAFMNVLGDWKQVSGENVVGGLEALMIRIYQIVSLILGTALGLVRNAFTAKLN